MIYQVGDIEGPHLDTRSLQALQVTIGDSNNKQQQHIRNHFLDTTLAGLAVSQFFVVRNAFDTNVVCGV